MSDSLQNCSSCMRLVGETIKPSDGRVEILWVNASWVNGMGMQNNRTAVFHEPFQLDERWNYVKYRYNAAKILSWCTMQSTMPFTRMYFIFLSCKLLRRLLQNSTHGNTEVRGIFIIREYLFPWYYKMVWQICIWYFVTETYQYTDVFIYDKWVANQLISFT